MPSLNSLLVGGALLLMSAGRVLRLGGTGVAIVTITPLIAGLYLQIIGANRGVVRIARGSLQLVVACTFVVLFLASMVRTQHPTYHGSARLFLAAFWFAVWVTAYLMFANAAGAGSRQWNRLIFALVCAPGTLVLANVVLYFLGVAPTENMYYTQPAGRMASWVGLEIDRVLFPLARGVANFGAVAGSALVGSALAWRTLATTSLQRRYALVITLASLVAVVLCDSRGALFFGFAAIGSVLVAARTQKLGLLRWMVPLVPALPALLLAGLTLIADTPVAETLSRQQGDVTSLTGRTFFWAAAAAELSRPRSLHLVGWGQYGQVASGVSQAYGDQFSYYVGGGELMSLHNMSLQLVFDVGYIGYAFTLLLCWVAIKRFAGWRDPEWDRGNAAIIGLIVYYLLIGTTEASISLYFPDNLMMLMMILAVMSVRSSNTTSRPAVVDGEPRGSVFSAKEERTWK